MRSIGASSEHAGRAFGAWTHHARRGVGASMMLVLHTPCALQGRVRMPRHAHACPIKPAVASRVSADG